MTCLLHMAVAFMVSGSTGHPKLELHLFEHTYHSAAICETAKASLMRDGALNGAAADGWCERCQ